MKKRSNTLAGHCLAFGLGGTCTMTEQVLSGKKMATRQTQRNGLKKSAELELLARDFAYHCTALRTCLRLSQSAFAKLIGVKNQEGKVTISRWESGAHTPQKKYLNKFMRLQKRYDRRK